jgi:hypothetical protein
MLSNCGAELKCITRPVKIPANVIPKIKRKDITFITLEKILFFFFFLDNEASENYIEISRPS